MATSVVTETTSYAFDDRNIRWYEFGEFEHFVFAMLDIDNCPPAAALGLMSSCLEKQN